MFIRVQIEKYSSVVFESLLKSWAFEISKVAMTLETLCMPTNNFSFAAKRLISEVYKNISRASNEFYIVYAALKWA